MNDIAEQFAIDVRGISKCYQIYDRPSDRLKQALFPRIHRAVGIEGTQFFREFWALRDVSFSVRPGETVGIIGRNGAGKSTLLQLICGTLMPTAGSISTNGRIAALLELGSGFNPEFSGRENVYMNAAVLGLSEAEIEERYERIVAFSEIGDFIDQPVKTYSSGMYMRLAFAVQAHIDASIVIIDEALTVGDVFFRQKCYARLDQLREAGTAIILVSHSMPDIEQYCERAILLDRGEVRHIGSASEAAKLYYLLSQGKASESPRAEVQRRATVNANAGVSVNLADWPEESFFLDIADKTQVGTGEARCVGVALLNKEGQPCNVFKQGETAVFYYEFEIAAEIDVPVVGLLISNERGIIVHGKNNLQFDGDTVGHGATFRRVRCRQEVTLAVGVGDYTFQVGLAETDRQYWDNRTRVGFEVEMDHVRRICHLANVGSFTVMLNSRNGVTYLTHHGMVNLEGSIMVETES